MAKVLDLKVLRIYMDRGVHPGIGEVLESVTIDIGARVVGLVVKLQLRSCYDGLAWVTLGALAYYLLPGRAEQYAQLVDWRIHCPTRSDEDGEDAITRMCARNPYA